MRQVLNIDIETYSSIDLKTAGVYNYVNAPDFTILMIAVSYNDGDVMILDSSDLEDLVSFRTLLLSLENPEILKTAFNANFERTCLAKFFGIELPADQWECTMVKAAMMGLPMSLEQVAKVLKLDQQKDSLGKTYIRYFSLPCKPTKANGMRTRNLPEHAPEKWEAFKQYCIQDVKTEKAIRERLNWYKIPAGEKELWTLDQRINDYGVRIDRAFVKAAIAIDEVHRKMLTEKAVRLTGLQNPNSAAQLKQWLSASTGEEISSLKKADIPELLKATDCGITKQVLEIRQEMSKTSVKKYDAMLNCVCPDERVRGLLQLYGANRTGRWAGRLVQVQNLPQNHLEDLDVARQVVKMHDAATVAMLFDSVPDTLTQLIRTAFVAPEGYRFIVADFSAIEARVIAWLANERWRMGVFRSHGKIYEASAAQMFKVPIESITKGSALRQKGKVSELALGYQGGPNALINMGALKMGIPEEELPKLVKMWRNANPAIVQLWTDVEYCAIAAVETGAKISTKLKNKRTPEILFYTNNDCLFVKLPSGRELVYLQPRLEEGKYGKYALTYMGMNQTTKTWGKQDTYGGKLVENIVQAIARDCLAVAMLRLDRAGYTIVMSVHDEVVLEVENNTGSLKEVNEIMSTPIAWATGLPLTADSYETNYYKKD